MTLQIGEVAKRSQVTKDTIRYYERLGLIPEPTRTDAGYRTYAEEIVERLSFIKRMKELGFTLKEIDKLLGVVDKDQAKCSDVIEFSKEKLIDVQDKIRDLQNVEKMLMDLQTCCGSPNETGIYECEIIETTLKGKSNCDTK
ncbi:MerR family transcriptional regulator [Aquibacillus albus]|uniref:MerR family mercuric resistance operon transcriptional regulator n=1 Tax=Aquibacillus albus TaxID=1168171 RepID=A0ABS2N184_9BACI|nr:MerR family transcriptional regulator [Aquibacillus albus]MBM7571911.1 MerR family mercuric resistance operon transcriptional regulator [Aquibacillus albus]